MAQMIVLLSSVVKSLVVPKILGVEDYGYWQIYVLYSGFVGVFALGYSDGVYLRFGGKDYSKLPFKHLRASSRIYACSLATISVAICIASIALEEGLRSSALFFVGVDVAFVCFSGYLLYVLQVTDRFREYSLLVVSDKVAMAVIIVVMVALGVTDPRQYMFWDFATKALACLLVVWRCREIVFGPAAGIIEGARYYVRLCKSGLSLLLANFAGMFVVSAGRIAVELFGDITEYANYSLGITVTNLVLTLVNAVGLAIYPSLKRLPAGSLPSFFGRVDNAVGVVSALALVCYAPGSLFVAAVFPQYAGMLEYLPLLFVAVIAEVRMQLLCNTFFKATGLARLLLVVNLASLASVAIVAPLLYTITGSVTALAFATAAVMTARSLFSYRVLAKTLGLSVGCRVAAEAGVAMGFAIVSAAPGFIGLGASFVLSIGNLAARVFTAARREV
ncbi:lipopolysaccharide biosynthesis protein [Collinsella ihumii]|uniref:Polysaccharide biosynthesis protein C-terminal domain-containing protein n=1 Tax=Collinsella ihumii TaxID=1720204 RepID=A0AAW7JUI0_9ACTN|nr:hypothetical protein [Collinsella ihumii]MDN0069458.1 hypothetical protein [Collinsella ihumii]